jgi:aminoglycoside phosphotransferase (APT) family kinase protein
MELQLHQIRLLIDSQFPEFKNLEICKVKNSGHDNHSYHLGDYFSLRFPSADAYSTQVIKEHRYLKALQKSIPIPITQPLFLGKPSELFPYHFSINQWIDGESVTKFNIQDKNAFALELAQFLIDLQTCDTKDGILPGTHNFYRGASLSIYHDETIQAIKECKLFNKNKCLDIWMKANESEFLGKPVWIHGDFELGNILIKNGHLSAVIDFGNMAIGDPACDYVIAWTYFDKESRKIFFDKLKVDDYTINRAKAWALWKALITLDDPKRQESASYTLNELLCA